MNKFIARTIKISASIGLFAGVFTIGNSVISTEAEASSKSRAYCAARAGNRAEFKKWARKGRGHAALYISANGEACGHYNNQKSKAEAERKSKAKCLKNAKTFRNRNPKCRRVFSQ